MLGLFISKNSERALLEINNFAGLTTNEPKIVFFNELISLPKNMPGMFAVNIWNLRTKDTVVCSDENAALYLSKVPGPKKIALGFDYDGFTRINSLGELKVG